jgi:prolyl oligopeptidase
MPTIDATAQSPDPHLWLEELDSPEARSWVQAQNERTVAALCDARFERDRALLLKSLAAPRVPRVNRRAELLYDFSQGQRNPRGIWRRTSLAAYRAKAPEWEVVLDLDALAAAEGENWVWRGCITLPPQHRHGLVQLSRGGGDAVVIREFDLLEKRFVENGFSLPEARGNATWWDPDTLLVTSLLGGERFVTSCGQERTIRKWARGTRFEDAEVIFECAREDVTVGGWRTHYSRPERTFFLRVGTNFDAVQYFEDDGGRRHLIDVPAHHNVMVHRDWLLVNLKSEWRAGDRVYAAGSLIVIDFQKYLAGERNFVPLFEPSERRFLDGYCAGGDTIALRILDNVRTRISLARFADARWTITPVSGFPELATVEIAPLDFTGFPWPIDEQPDRAEFLISVSNTVMPPARYLLESGRKQLALIDREPASFDASGLVITQHEAISSDRTRVPYFQVSRADLKLNGENPVLMTGYGGAGFSQLPFYNAAYGKLWLERGGVFVIANIRGGNELGAAWHKAGERQGRKLSHDDFAAVAGDLISRGVTKPSRLACEGGSLGGLLVTNMLTRYPTLFGAIFCAIPVTDLRRFAVLGAAIHIAEFGDPDQPNDWSFMQEMSPYHCIDNDGRYPPILLVTSTRDDRAHPAHARKMAAELVRQGHRALFYESLDGGHGIGTTPKERAFWYALQIAFLRATIAPEMI